MTKKYTPGPWKKDKYGQLVGSDERQVCIWGAGLANTTTYDSVGKANAILISCAPELLEALEAAMDYINNCPCDPDIYPEQWAAWEKLSDIQPMNLIKRAKGE